MKIYSVYSGTYDDVHVDQIFSTRELAQQYIDLTDEGDRDVYMPGWSMVSEDMHPHLRIYEVEVDQVVPMMNDPENIYIGNMDIDGNITFLYRKFDQILGWENDVWHIMPAYKDDEGHYQQYYIDATWEQGVPSNYLVFKVKADSQESAINTVNTKRLKLIDDGVFKREVTENFVYIRGDGEDDK
jgi:hypothetical protein